MSNVKAYLEDIVRDGLHDIAEALKESSPTGDVQASHVIYDNTESGLTSNRVQGAIDELCTKVDSNASDISDLTTRMGTAEGDITSLDGRLDTAEGDITALETWKNNLDASDIPYGSETVKDALDVTPRLVYVGTGSIPSINSDAQQVVTHNMGVTVNNPLVIVNLGQNRFQWEVNGTSGGTLTMSFRNVSATAASGSYKVFVFDIG